MISRGSKSHKRQFSIIYSITINVHIAKISRSGINQLGARKLLLIVQHFCYTISSQYLSRFIHAHKKVNFIERRLLRCIE